MFTVKQETNSGHMIWPAIATVSAECTKAAGCIDVVFARPAVGGEYRFDCSPNKHVIYVMNEAGATVARYDLGGRANAAAGASLAEPQPIAA